jgi:hypothetical protein
MPAGKPVNPMEKTRTWTMPTVLSLILTVVGAVSIIELRPQLNVTPQEQLATGQPFSAPFEITNSGYLGIHVNNIVVIFHRVEVPGASWDDSFIQNTAWNNFDLDRCKSKTILPYLVHSNAMPTEADIVCAIDYTFWGKKLRSFFRFEGIRIDKWQWSKL